MTLNWLDVTDLSFNALLLLERVQLSWLPGSDVPRSALALALRANPAVEWYLRHKCPDLNDWLDGVLVQTPEQPADPAAVRQAEVAVLQALNDWMVYGVDPATYDAQPFLGWDSAELTALVDFAGKVVIDVGAGTGRLAFVAAPVAAAVYAVEPVENLRRYMKEKARARGLRNLYTVDGLITEIPLPDALADVTMGGHVFGEFLEDEYRELSRVTKPGGLIILCPGNNDQDNAVHQFLVTRGFAWSRFEEPGDGPKRKYWKCLP